MSYENITLEVTGRIAKIALNRPKALNAINSMMMAELTEAFTRLEQDGNIHVVILKGNEKAFAAGADIKEMLDKTASQAYRQDFITKGWKKASDFRKPIIASVAGYALGGGCELAMICDMIIAADNAQFGQPEVTLGILPGAGGTQRLVRAIGKAKAMEMCLTGRLMKAEEAEQAGLVSMVVPADQLDQRTEEVAKQISKYSLPAVMMIKESINTAFETTLETGVSFERKLFYASFASDDQKEGMTAFIEKRQPNFTNK